MTRALALPLAACLALSTFACSSAPPAQPAAAAPATSAPKTRWGYEGPEGPEHWGDLSPEYARCKTGAKQSPIDLPAAPAADATLGLALPRYEPAPLRVKNTGHTVQVDVASGAAVTLGGVAYALQQFHFHAPSEHTIGGKRFDAEAHLVHKSTDGRLLVVAILLQKGGENPALAPLLAELPVAAGAERRAEGVTVDLQALLPKAPRFFHYEGSLTAPPCTEGVQWLVVEPEAAAPIELSEAELTRIRAALGGASSRPSQPAGGRTVGEVRP